MAQVINEQQSVATRDEAAATRTWLQQKLDRGWTVLAILVVTPGIREFWLTKDD